MPQYTLQGGAAVRMELLENGCLKILLTESDMQQLHLNFEQLDYTSEVMQEALRELLLQAREKTGFDAGGNLLVEALPIDKGCLLLLTPTGGRRRVRMKRVSGPYIYEIDTADHLLQLANGWCRYAAISPSSAITGSSLYRFGNRYRLILYTGTPLNKGILQLLQEFAKPTGEGDAAAAFAAEHGEPMVIGDALGRLCRALSPPE